MSALGNPKASPAAVAAVQEALRTHHTTVGPTRCACGWDRRDEVGSVLGGLFAEHVAQAAADAAAPHNAATAELALLAQIIEWFDTGCWVDADDVREEFHKRRADRIEASRG